ncbi:GNAT family N-acetyltransferase [Paenibacillus sp. MMO-58]|uniref:GNAT family N-acetyltransferase n=1 Tax=Paenibacillus sp. MMO-58 TaxID=3081290 RepID=UPI00301B653F
MLSMVEISEDLLQAEMDILNSDPVFNRVTIDSEVMSPEDLARDKENGSKIGAERYLIKEGERFVGILEFLMLNPSDNCTWLGLLQVDKKLQGHGYGPRMLDLYLEEMRRRNVSLFRIGVLEGNDPALGFWRHQGFEDIKMVKTVINNRNKTVFVLEKKIEC